MYALYSRDLGNFQLNGEEEVVVYWVTARSLDMTIPGGVVLHGYVAWPEEDKGLPWAEFFRDINNQSWKDALHLFAGALGIAHEKKLEDEAEESATFEALDYVKPMVTEGVTHRKTMFVHAFRESEAAHAAFEAGLRSEKWGEYWRWPALGKVQEKALASAYVRG